MNKCPKIGTRVRYDAILHKGESFEQRRTCVGVVVAIYPAHNDKFDDDGRLIQRGGARPQRQWSVGVKVDAPLPKWWPYPNTDRFAPDVADLKPEYTAKQKRSLQAVNKQLSRALFG